MFEKVYFFISRTKVCLLDPDKERIKDKLFSGSQ